MRGSPRLAGASPLDGRVRHPSQRGHGVSLAGASPLDGRVRHQPHSSSKSSGFPSNAMTSLKSFSADGGSPFTMLLCIRTKCAKLSDPYAFAGQTDSGPWRLNAASSARSAAAQNSARCSSVRPLRSNSPKGAVRSARSASQIRSFACASDTSREMSSSITE